MNNAGTYGNERISEILNGFVLTVALATLVAWAFGINELTNPFGLAPMNSVSALCFLLLGLAVLFQHRRPGWHKSAIALSFLVTAFGTLVFLQFLSGKNIGADSWLFAQAQKRVVHSSMSLPSSINFILIGSALVAININPSRWGRAAHYCVLISSAFGLIALLGYIYNEKQFYFLFLPVPMSLQSSLSSIALSVSILLMDRNIGLARIFSKKLAGNTAGRRLVPAAILIPAGLGYLKLLGTQRGWFTDQFGSAVFIVLLIITYLVFIAATATVLNRRDVNSARDQIRIEYLNEQLQELLKERTDKLLETEYKMSEQQEWLRLFVEYSPAAVAMLDHQMKYILASKSWLKQYNIKREPIIGLSHYDVFPTIPERLRIVHLHCLQGATEKSDFDSFVTEDGATIYNRWEVRPWYKRNGEIGGIIMLTEVITEIIEAEMKFRNLGEKSEVGVYISQDGKYKYSNPRFAEMLEYTENEILSISVSDVLDDQELKAVENSIQPEIEHEQSGSHYRVKTKTKTGRPVSLDVYGSATTYNGKNAIIGMVLDVTEITHTHA